MDVRINTTVNADMEESDLIEEETPVPAPSLFDYKRTRTFDYKRITFDTALGVIGLPRTLDIYDTFPFWLVFFTECRYSVELSPLTTEEILRESRELCPDKDACMPFMLSYGHVKALIDKGIKTIFYPSIKYTKNESESAKSNAVCPLTEAAPFMAGSALEKLIRENNVRFLTPVLSFESKDMMEKQLIDFMKNEFGLKKVAVHMAVKYAWDEQQKVHEDVADKGLSAIRWGKQRDRKGIVLASAPYYIDPVLEAGIPDMIKRSGHAVLTEDAVSSVNLDESGLIFESIRNTDAKLVSAAKYVSGRNDLEMVFLSEKGCGCLSAAANEAGYLLEKAGKKLYTFRFDRNEAPEDTEKRVNDLLSSMDLVIPETGRRIRTVFPDIPAYTKEMHTSGRYTVLLAGVPELYAALIESAFKGAGYNAVSVPYANDGASCGYVPACAVAESVSASAAAFVSSGKYDRESLAVLTLYSGSACQEANFAGYIRNALSKQGYADIPVISADFSRLDKASALALSARVYMKLAEGVLLGDLILLLRNRLKPYEKQENQADVLFEKCMKLSAQALGESRAGKGAFLETVRTIIGDFDAADADDKERKPGLIFTGPQMWKFSAAALSKIKEAEASGKEAVMTGLSGYVNFALEYSLFRQKFTSDKVSDGLAEKQVAGYFEELSKKAQKELARSRHFSDIVLLPDITAASKTVLPSANKSFECMAYAGDIASLRNARPEGLVWLMPGGCSLGAITAKGIEKEIKAVFPDLN